MNPAEVVPFIEAALDGMLDIAATLGDGLINERPDLRGANSPYVILHHCVGVADWWIGAMIGGRTHHRNREAEFTAMGTVADLQSAVAGVRERIAGDLAGIEPLTPIEYPERVPEGSIARGWTQAAALVHTLEELAQHRGQMELTRDMLLVERGDTT